MKILDIPDLHEPWSLKRGLLRMFDFCRSFQPDVIIQGGDLYDNYLFSKYTTHVNDLTPQQELRRGRKKAEDMWKTLKTIAPKARCIQLMGNHCARIYKRLLERLPALDASVKIKGKIQHLHNIDSLFQFDGVESVLDYTKETRIANALVLPGWAGNLGDHMRYYRSNCITQHTHKGGVVFEEVNGKVLWELNCGYLGDAKARCFKYGDHRMKKWTPGFGAVDGYGPRFIAL